MKRASLALLVLAACGDGDGDPGRSRATARGSVSRDAQTAVLVVVDGLRRDHLRTYGYRLEPAPELTALAAESAVFEDAIAITTGANAGLASLLTGQHPTTHGVGSLRHRGMHRLADARVTLAELLRAAGWRTFGAASLPQLGREISGLDQGFERWYAPGLFEGDFRDAEATWYNAEPELRALLEGDERVFLLLHLADPGAREPAPGADGARFLEAHLGPFREERPLVAGALNRAGGDPKGALEDLQKLLGRGRGSSIHTAWREAGYDSRLAVVDRVLGELRGLLRETGREEQALLAVTATRGALLAPPASTGAPNFPPALFEVPLIVRFPAGAPRGPVTGVTSALDLAPTLAELLDVRLEAAQGKSLLPRIEGEPGPDVSAPLIAPGFEAAGRVDERFLVEEHRVGGIIAWHRAGTRALTSTNSPADEERITALRAVLEGDRHQHHAHLLIQSGGDWPLRVNWKLSSGFVGEGTLLQGDEPRTINPRGLSGTARFDPEPGELSARLGEREAPLRLDLDFGDEPLDEAHILIGVTPLTRSLMPRLPDRGAPDWPTGPEGAFSPAAALLEDRGSGWWRLSVGEALEPGLAVECLVTVHPPALVEEELNWDASHELDVQRIAGRVDALLVRGVTPLELSLERASPAQTFALAVNVDGETLTGAALRYGERAFAEPGQLSLYLPDWIDGVTDELGPTVASRADRPALEPGQLRISRVGPTLAPADRAPASDEERAFARKLGGRE